VNAKTFINARRKYNLILFLIRIYFLRQLRNFLELKFQKVSSQKVINMTDNYQRYLINNIKKSFLNKKFTKIDRI